MMTRSVAYPLALGSALAAVCGPAVAAGEKVLIAPPPAWVRPVAPPADDGKSTGAAIRMLLQDEQVDLQPGRQTSYAETVVRIQTPEGLQAGNLSIPWRPETDTLTVHKLLIRRGDKVIDVLASGQTFTVLRRETNLENAVLDGMLTANIQPEGLQVGDVLDVAMSISRADPVLQGHAEDVGGAWNMLPVGRVHLRMQWPSSLPLKLRQTAELPALKPLRGGGTTSVELSLDDLEPLNLPKGAPPRYRIGRLVEATDYDGWARLGTLMAPLYAKASALPAAGPLQAEVARIRALSPDPAVRTEAALALVQDRVRYVALAMGAGGYVPADAETTWSRRFGDCKGKTALLIGLLRALNVAAEPVLVSSIYGDGLDQRLPMAGLFNHVLVRATVAGKTYWLDGTRTGDAKLDRIQVPNFGWGLPVVPTNAALVRIVPPPLERPNEVATIRLDARDGLSVPAKVHAEVLYRGDAATAIRLALANLTADARERALRDYWKGRYDPFETATSTASYEPASGEERIVMDGTTKMDWSHGSYETDGSALGWKADFARTPGPDRDAPYAVAFPFYMTSTETVLLPPSFENYSRADGAAVDATVGGIQFRRRASIKDGVFTVESSQRSVAPEFASTEAPAAEKALRDMADRAVWIGRPSRYRETDKEVAASLQQQLTTAEEFTKRASMLLDHERWAEASADAGRAISLDPRAVHAHAIRGIAAIYLDDVASARRDLDNAAALQADAAMVERGRGLLAELDSNWQEAAARYTASLRFEPRNAWALNQRAKAYLALYEDDKARADADAALAISPGFADPMIVRAEILRRHNDNDAALTETARAIAANRAWTAPYLLRASIFRNLGRPDDVAREAAAATAAAPGVAYAHVAAARIYAAINRMDDARREFDQAIAIRPEGYIYLNRAVTRPTADVAGRRADLEAAYGLEPRSTAVVVALARFRSDTGDQRSALAILDQRLATDNANKALLLNRGIVRARTGQTALADSDFTAAQNGVVQVDALNDFCWSVATAGVALERALASCDAGLARRPDAPQLLDSRGFVLLRLGRVDEAIASYNDALAKEPRLAPSLFGRGLALARKADATADGDFAAALAIDPRIEQTFAGYGVTRAGVTRVATPGARTPPPAPARPVG